MDKLNFKLYNLNILQESKTAWENDEIKNPRLSLKGIESIDLTLEEAERDKGYSWSRNETDLDLDNQEVNIVYDKNFGDGREWEVALSFPKENLSVFLDGYYSSHGDSELDSVYFGVEFEFKEMRYRAASKEEIRDININTVIKED